MYPSIPVLALISTLFLAGCNNKSTPTEPTQPQKLAIVTTTGMITDPTTIITKNHAQVTGLMAAGIDPHLYKPTRTDIAKLMNADIILYNGLLLEGRMTDALIRLANSGITVQALTDSIDNTHLLSHPTYPNQHDPHLWMDPIAWSDAIEVIAQTLINHDPTNADDYRTNADDYKSQIAALHTYANKVLSTVPESQRILITAHDAFGYFGRRYNYEVVGIQGISTESEAGVRDIEHLVNLIVKNNIKAVFVETTVSERNIKALIAGANAQGHKVTIGGSLFSDAMGKAGTYKGTYIGMIDHNITTITRALGGTAPATGMQGKLSP
ncbi:MAG: zinc ABC transporter substrate-binding protein [Phycisphaerales bacterium]|nr:zinc ABC transporter substrate-binding protein [Phycisphaerales bacterium]